MRLELTYKLQTIDMPKCRRQCGFRGCRKHVRIQFRETNSLSIGQEAVLWECCLHHGALFAAEYPKLAESRTASMQLWQGGFSLPKWVDN